MSRFKLFIENFLVYGLGGLISKLIPFIMLPIITRLFPSSFYLGLNDLSVSLVSFISAIAILGLYDAMFRLFFEKEDLTYKKEICSTAFFFVLGICVSGSIVFLTIRTKIAEWYFESVEYTNLVVLTIISFLISTTNQIVSAPTRIQNKKKVFLVTNTVSPLLSYAVSIPLILQGHYIIAMPLAAVVSAATIEVSFLFMNREWFSPKFFRMERLKDLLKIGIPLMPNFIVYWIYNSVSNLMISKMLGTEYTGIFGIASRIGHISNLIYTAFAGGWLYFAYSTMNDEDQVGLKSKVFEYLAAISFVATGCLIAVDKIGFQLLFGEEYLEGYLIAPYLFLAPLLLMLFQTIANQFTIIKKTYLNTVTLFIGAAVCIGLDFMLIPEIGMEGAAIATVLGYVTSLAICIMILNRLKLVDISPRFYLCTVGFAVYFLSWRLLFAESMIVPIVTTLLLIVIYLWAYQKDITNLVRNEKKGK